MLSSAAVEAEEVAAVWPKADEHPRDNIAMAALAAAGVSFRRLSAAEHREREAEWRRIYGRAFRPGLHARHGQKAIAAYLAEAATHWLMVPFLADVAGIPVHASSLKTSAFECAGRLLELIEFDNDEFFISPLDFSWTYVRTHEDFVWGGPYFVRAEWVAGLEESRPPKHRQRKRR